jgi:1-deoxy-D-xylulose-5-phosphate synthase
MTIMMGKDENELQHLINTALKYDGGPIAVRLPRGNGVGVPMDRTLKVLPIGEWEVLQEGRHAAILSYGPTIQNALEAREALLKNGIEAEVINARSIKPLDETMLKNLAHRQIPIVVFEEAVEKGSFGSGVLEFFSEQGEHQTIVEIMGVPDRFIEHGGVNELLKEIHLTTEALVNKVTALVSRFAKAKELRS